MLLSPWFTQRLIFGAQRAPMPLVRCHFQMQELSPQLLCEELILTSEIILWYSHDQTINKLYVTQPKTVFTLFEYQIHASCAHEHIAVEAQFYRTSA